MVALSDVNTVQASKALMCEKGVINVSVLNIVLLVVWFVSAVATIILVLMHSGKGTGVSDMIASSMYNATSGSGVWEKNLDRFTVIFASIFILSLVVMMLTFPLGTLGY